ncbi:hypothetical protein [Yoonia vestfoldensis]|uniref:hypothetical protein n=1 Tax=Yoonia vestfoldensis TaxID=245188 RepID=UPI00036C232C|nr:hypothetical protein [Yoonia vestfoldensis]
MSDYLAMIGKAISATLALPDTFFRDLPDTPSFADAKPRKAKKQVKQKSAYKPGKGYKAPAGWRILKAPPDGDRQK